MFLMSSNMLCNNYSAQKSMSVEEKSTVGCASIEEFIQQPGSDLRKVKVDYATVSRIVKRKAREAAITNKVIPGRRFDPIRRTIQYYDAPRVITKFDKFKYSSVIKEYFANTQNTHVYDSLTHYLNKGYFTSKLERLHVIKQLSLYKDKLAHGFYDHLWSNLTPVGYVRFTQIGQNKIKDHYWIQRFCKKAHYFHERQHAKFMKRRLRLQKVEDKIRSNRFILLPVDPCAEVFVDTSDEDCDELPVYRSTTVNRYDIETISLDDLELLRQQYAEIDAKVKYYFRQSCDIVRNLDLLRKLRTKIRYLVNIRTGHADDNCDIEMDVLSPAVSASSLIQPEMMDSEQPTQQQSSGPVVLNALQSDEAETPLEIVNDNFWIRNSTSDTVVDQKHASSMEILAKRFVWKSNFNINYNIFNIDLPNEALIGNMNHPAAMMFGQYAYWNGDMKVRIHINTTPFHIGLLIFSWYYAGKFDANVEHRNNIASSVQLPHVFYNASEGADVVMNIPFRNYRSMLCTRNKSDDSLPLYLGTLRCHVMNPLTLDTSTEVDGYLHINFENSSFTGIVPRADIQPEMFPTRKLIKAAEGGLHLIDKCMNMDKPSNPSVPLMQTPQFSDSFATGTGDVSNVHMLRLDPLGQTQHPTGSSTKREETNINNIIREWGYLTSLTWKASLNQGQVLYRLPVSPELDYNNYYSVSLKHNGQQVTAYVLPPVSVISSINAYNRGSIEYKFQIINSKYHTGALLVSFTPVMYNVSLNQALQSYNTTLDIGNISEYVFKVPYINERPYNPRFNKMDATDLDPILAPIGELNVFVLNQLRNVSGSSDHVYINVYIRAGDDFEVAVPVSPLYSVLYDSEPIPKKDYITFINPGNEIGIDNWRYAVQAPRLGVIKSGPSADAIMQFDNIKPFVVYQRDYGNDACKIQSPFAVQQYLYPLGNLDNISNELEYICMFITNNDGNKYRYGITFTREADAKNYCQIWSSMRTTTNPYPDSPKAATWMNVYPTIARGYVIASSGSYRNLLGPKDKFRWVKIVDLSESNIVPEGNEVMIDPTKSVLMSTNNGMRMFGESFTDLKDYCRRYQPYCGTVMSIPKQSRGVLVRVPISPIGLNPDGSNGSVLHKIREGLIPFIASAFRFYRGSLRFKVILSGLTRATSLDGEVLYVQHKPDIILGNRNIVTKPLVAESPASLILQSGYAYTGLSMNVNNSINIEVPFYCPTNLLMLQAPDFSRKAETIHYAMGVLDLYLSTNMDQAASYYLQMHYALADDMDFSCFVGFPPMVPLYDLREPALETTFENLMIEPQMDVPSTSKQAVEKEKAEKEVEKVESQGIGEKIKTKVKNYLFNTVREDMGIPVSDTSKPDTIMGVLKDMIKKIGKEYAHVIYSSVSQIIHCLNNPSVSTFAIAFVTICCHLGFEMFDKIKDVTKWFINIFRKTNVKPEEVEVAEEVVAEMAGDNKTETSPIDAKKSIISLIVKESARIMNVSWDKITSIPKFFSTQFFAGLRNVSSAINQFILLLKNLCDVIPNIFNWIGKKFRPKKWLSWFIHDKNELITRWVNDVEYVTDPNLSAKIKSSVKYLYQVELLVILGRDICGKVQSLKEYTYSYLSSLNKRLLELYSEVAGRHSGAGSIGIEPFCFCLHGQSQVGKTHVTKQLANECLKAIDFMCDGEIYYTRGAQKHWDGLENQPVCVLDDFGHIKEQSAVAEYMAEFLHLKSKATFSPPRADIADKGKKYSPLIVAMTMNEPFERFENVVANPMAWQARRDVLIEVIFAPPADYAHASRVSELPMEVTEGYHHLRFKIHKYNSIGNEGNNDIKLHTRVLVPRSEVDKNMIEVETLTYYQISWYLSKAFMERYQWMKREYAKDFQAHMSFTPKTDETFDKNIKDYVEHLKQTAKRMNAREAMSLEKIVSTGNCYDCNYPKYSCMCDVGLFKTANVGCLKNPQAEMAGTLEIYIPTHVKTSGDFLSFLVSKMKYVKDRHFDELYRQYDLVKKDRTISKDVYNFFKTLCIHTYVSISFINSWYCMIEDGKVMIIAFNEVYSADAAGCECMEHNRLVESEYKDRLRKSLEDVYGSNIPIPAYLAKIDFTKSVSQQLRDLEEKRRKADLEKLQTKVDKSTWLGETAATLLGILIMFSPFIMIGTLLAMADKVQERNITHESMKIRKEMIKLRAAMMVNHEPSESCLDGCDICTPEMAYDQNKLLTTRTRKIVIPKHVVAPQMATEIRDSLCRKLRRNTFFIVGITSDMSVIASRCVGLVDRWFIGVDHYFDKFRSLSADTRFYIKHSMFETEISLHEIEIQNISDSAIRMCRLPIRIPVFANIVNKIASADVIPNMSPKAALIVMEHEDTMRKIQDYTLNWYNEEMKFHDDTLHIPHIVTGDQPQTSVGSYWSYRTSGKGLCGSVLISRMNTISPIVGIHIAGEKKGGKGFAEVICRETIENVINQYELKTTDIELEGQMFGDEMIHFDEDVSKAKSVIHGNIAFIGVVPKKFMFKPSPTSKCVHSLCYNEITQSTYDWPHLSPNDPRFEGSPMVKGCLHHTQPPKSFDKKDLEIVVTHIKEMILAKVKPLRNKIGVLSVNQAIEGIHDIPGYDAMEMDTSEGFPFLSRRPRGAHDKKWLFDIETTNKGYIIKSIDPLLTSVMQSKHEQRVNGIIPMTVFTDCLKDLKLPAEKCDRTRIFSVSPVDFTIQFRQYFYDFTIAFQETRFNIESAVGINVDSYEWSEMVQKLLECSNHFVCGDYSKFGPRLMSDCVQSFFDIIIEWYKHNGDTSEENARVRYIMGQEITFSKHLMFDFVYEVHCGAPSGCPITTILNNGVNMMYLRIAYLHLCKTDYQDERKRSGSFTNNVCVIFYGDDLIMTVKEDLLDRFNANTISQFMAKYDIKFTNALKKSTFLNSADVFSPDTSFLKRNIKRHPYRPLFTAAMDKRAIEETCNWVYKNHDEPEASVLACEAMLLNAHGHGPDYYNSLRNKVMLYWREYNIVPQIPLWSEVDHRIYDE